MTTLSQAEWESKNDLDCFLKEENVFGGWAEGFAVDCSTHVDLQQQTHGLQSMRGTK